MTIEEKAKRYNEALERAKKAKNNASLSKGTLRVLDIIFPELKESEDKCIEKIKKDIISYLNNRQITSIAESSATERWLSWLEKQCEQKPVEEYNGEDYGIDSLYHAQRILEKTLGKVSGYQTDDGILSHQCAITAVKKLYRQESNWNEEDEKIRNQIINFIEEYGSPIHCEWQKDWIAWLEKQGSPATLSEEEQNRFAKGVLSNCALSFINYLEAHKYEGKMCVSDGECEDIENAFHNAMWDRLHRYYCKYIEKQGEQNYKIIKGKNYFCVKTHNYAGVKWIKGTKYYASDNYTLVNQGCEYYCPEYSKEEHNNLFEEVKYDGCVENKMSANKVEPKFKVGELIKYNKLNVIYKVISVNNGSYCVENIETGGRLEYFNAEQNFHLWTIADAKDGDVLVSQYNKPFIYNGNRDYFRIGSYCGISVDDKFKVATEKCNWAENVNIYPSTKEQRELLFTKMKESGYEWDDEEKELKKIDDEPENYKQQVMTEMTNLVKDYIRQKPSWSEEDEKMVKDIQNRWKPSDEQIKAIRLARSFVVDDFSDHPTLSEILMELEEQLQKIKEE